MHYTIRSLHPFYLSQNCICVQEVPLQFVQCFIYLIIYLFPFCASLQSLRTSQVYAECRAVGKCRVHAACVAYDSIYAALQAVGCDVVDRLEK